MFVDRETEPSESRMTQVPGNEHPVPRKKAPGNADADGRILRIYTFLYS
jgi:hypothetical protein